MLADTARTHELKYGKLRNGETLAARLDDQCRDDRQRQRNLDGEFGPDSRNRLQVDGATDLLDVGPHHVHADAPAGNTGHSRRGGKAGDKNEIADFRVGLDCQLSFSGETLFECFGSDARNIEATAVVSNLNDDVPTLMKRVEPDRSRRGLSRGKPFSRIFDAMVGTIPDQMRERILDQLEHLAVELGIGAAHLQIDILVEFGAEIADYARKFLPRIADGLHACLHHAFLQLGGHVRKPLQRYLEIGIFVPAHDLKQLVAGEHQLGDRRHQIIERVDVDADRMTYNAVAAFIVGTMGCEPLCRLGLLQLFKFLVSGRPWRRPRLVHQAAEVVYEVLVAAVGLLLPRLELVEDYFDPINRGECDGDGFRGDRHAVAEFSHERFRSMGQPFEARQSKKAACTLDGVNQSKDVAENLGIVGLALEAHQFGVNAIEILVGLGQELAEQVVHETAPLSPSALVRVSTSITFT